MQPTRAARSHAFLLTLAAMSAALTAQGTPTGFEETWALSSNRSKTLELLIPGSKDWFYYRCLDRQLAGDLAAVGAILDAWRAARPDDTQQQQRIANRQALLNFANDPARTFEYLKEYLHPDLNAVRVDTSTTPDLPTELNPASIMRDAFFQQALAKHQNSLAGVNATALPWLATANLDDAQLRQFLDLAAGNDDRPDIPNLPALIERDLATSDSAGFGSLTIHMRLRWEALQECLRLRPELIRNTQFVQACFARITPSADVDLDTNPVARGQHLARLWQFAQPLAPTFNTEKAQILYHYLRHDLSQGAPDKARFLAYIQLPRDPQFATAGPERTDPNDWVRPGKAAVPSLPALASPASEQELIRTCLEYFFATEDSAAPYTNNLRAEWVQRVLAETKLVLGQGDAQRWYGMLASGDAARALEQRVEITFPPTLPRTYAANDRVTIEVDTKNTPKLLVRVFAIDAFRWLSEKGQPIDTSIDLDGLTATTELEVPCPEAPIRRVRRRLELPRLDQPGTYIVECVGNGVRSRALIHKGELRCTERPVAAGHALRVFDEAGVQVKDAAVWFGGTDYRADAGGLILVPFASAAQARTIVLHRGDRANLAVFSHAAEQYTLRSATHVDRESLIAGARAHLLVRPELSLAGQTVGIELLQKPELTIVATDIDGITTTEHIRDIKLVDEREFVHEFAVPARLASLTISLSGTLRTLRGDDIVLNTHEQTFRVNGDDTTATTYGSQLVRTVEGHSIELRGKNGEPKPNRVVAIKLWHPDFRDAMELSLRTDATGRIELGPLAGFDCVQFDSDGAQQWIPLDTAHANLPSALHGLAGETLRVPYQGKSTSPTHAEFSLLGTDRDEFAHLAIENGFLELRDLAPGDYELRLHALKKVIFVSVTKGTNSAGWMFGATRQLESSNPAPLQLSKLRIAGDELLVSVANPTASTRVTVVATRYATPFSLFGLADTADHPLASSNTPHAENRFDAGRMLDSEYRYVLERRFATKYPGNMLERPSLLLNSWEVKSTIGFSTGGPASASPATNFDGNQWNSAVGMSGGAGGTNRGMQGNLDFLPQPSVLLANLTPDADGLVRVKLADLGQGQVIHVLALDGEQAIYDSLVRDEQPLVPRARLLANALDSTQHLTEQKHIEFVAAGVPTELPDARNAEAQMFDSLASVHKLLLTISSDESLARFAFLLQWPTLETAKKQELYSEHACHELHFFLYHKDRAFFDAVCKPLLQSKHDKTFLDHWLLGDDLKTFTEPWAFAQLNLIEQILLSQRLGASERREMARCLQEALELRPVSTIRLGALLTQTIALDRLSAMDSGSLGLVEHFAKPTAAPAEKAAEPAQDREGRSKDKALRDQDGIEDEKAEASKESAFDSNQWNSAVGLGGAGGGGGARLRAELQQRGLARQLYRAVEPTKLFVEHDYWHRQNTQTTPDLVPPNHFWADYAAATPGQPFVSASIIETGGSFLEMMMALSVMDLPFEAGKHEVTVDGDRRTLRAATPLLLVKKEIQKTEKATDLPPLLLGENFYRLDDRYRYENGERRDAFVTDEFLAGVAYGCQVVITNPTSSKRTTELLLQIPAGAIPVQIGFWTKGVTVELQPYATQSIEYAFYFPAAGEYAHYPAHAAEKGKLAANAEPRTLHVVANPTKVDLGSWDHVSQQGTAAEVMTFLDTHNVQRIDLSKVAWRMKDREFFAALLPKLRALHAYDSTLWSYSLLHRDAQGTREYLEYNQDFQAECGFALASPLLTIDPIENKQYRHLELDPLVFQRSHRFGDEQRIGNRDLEQQFRLLMIKLGYQPKLDSEDWLVVTYYLLLQNRIEDGLAAFAKVDRSAVHETLQFDYLQAYLCFFTADIPKARSIAERYRAYPVPHWQKRFAEVLAQLDEVEGKSAPVAGDPTADSLAATAPAIELALEAKNLTVRYKNVAQCEVRYYELDVEFAFSAQPFAGKNGTTAAFVQPNLRETKGLPQTQGELTFALPAQFAQKNVLVEVRAGGLLRAQTYFSNALAVRFLESYGQVAVTEPGNNTPLPKTYVKVFAKLPNGEVRFHKDGYTDLRGRFDYASVSDDPNAGAVRYSVLVLNEQRGAVIREVAPPTR
jgi:hypothetical protein